MVQIKYVELGHLGDLLALGTGGIEEGGVANGRTRLT